MNREELETLIAEVQRQQTELDDLEIKCAREGTPGRLYEPLSAFANRSGGGVLLFGLDEKGRFEIVGVKNAHRLQEEISHLAASEMEPPLRPAMAVEDFDGKLVVTVEITGLPNDRKPCFYKPAGLQKGSYIRVGNTNRVMTDYEIFGYVSARQQPVFDQEPVGEATLADLDQERLRAHVAGLRRLRPRASYLNQTLEQVLLRCKILQNVSGVWRPTLAGLLVFSQDPQQFEPQLVITFLQFYGTTETEPAPSGARFLDNRKFEGPIPEMVVDAVNHLMATIRKSSLIEGLYRRELTEYPLEAVREAVMNAVAHRDYSHFARGSYIQIRLFADRLEVQSPGGLFGNVAEETIETEQSTRNRTLMRLMEETEAPDGGFLVENRGSGINTMLGALRRANLEPPRFMDKRSSFWVVFKNHTLLSPEAVTWLNRFAHLVLNDRQRLVLAFLRQNPQVTNGDYQRLNHTDALTAGRELRDLVHAGVLEPNSSRRWTYYTLVTPAKKPVEPSQPASQADEEERILQRVRERGSINNADCRALLRVEESRAWYLLKKLCQKRKLTPSRSKRWRRYELP